MIPSSAGPTQSRKCDAGGEKGHWWRDRTCSRYNQSMKTIRERRVRPNGNYYNNRKMSNGNNPDKAKPNEAREAIQDSKEKGEREQFFL